MRVNIRQCLWGWRSFGNSGELNNSRKPIPQHILEYIDGRIAAASKNSYHGDEDKPNKINNESPTEADNLEEDKSRERTIAAKFHFFKKEKLTSHDTSISSSSKVGQSKSADDTNMITENADNCSKTNDNNHSNYYNNGDNESLEIPLLETNNDDKVHSRSSPKDLLYRRQSNSNFSQSSDNEFNNSSQSSWRYFTVLYSRPQTKKRKTWEDDGFIYVSSDFRAILKGSSGEIIESADFLKLGSEELGHEQPFEIGRKMVLVLEETPEDPFP